MYLFLEIEIGLFQKARFDIVVLVELTLANVSILVTDFVFPEIKITIIIVDTNHIPFHYL